jgi:hypothetical protein
MNTGMEGMVETGDMMKSGTKGSIIGIIKIEIGGEMKTGTREEMTREDAGKRVFALSVGPEGETDVNLSSRQRSSQSRL